MMRFVEDTRNGASKTPEQLECDATATRSAVEASDASVSNVERERSQGE